MICAPENVLGLDLWNQDELVGGLGFDGAPRVEKREVVSFAPEWQKIGVVRTARLTALSRHVDRKRFVPISGVENLAITGAVALCERVFVIAGRINSLAVSRASDGPKIHE